jgi:FkbM family methyltransferase
MAKIKYNGQTIIIKTLYDNELLNRKYYSKGGFHEIRLLEKIKQLNRKGVYIDVGANVGNHSIFFGLFCPSTKVISIEAEKKIVGVLTENLSKNLTDNKYEIYNYAISDFNGFVEMSNVIEGNPGSTHVLNEGKGDVECTTIDDLLSDVTNIAVMKFDIEGHEIKALKKSTEIIKKYKPIIITEIKKRQDFNVISEILNEYGYKCDNVNYAITPTYIWI